MNFVTYRRTPILALCLQLALLLFGGAPALGAQIAYLQPNSVKWDIQLPDPSIPCNLTLEGAIEKGDAERLAGLLKAARTPAPEPAPGWEERDIVCLNSPGGSFAEALKIATLLKSNFVGTKIEDGKRCESACSLIFMAGSFFALESGVYKWRVLHPRGLLGFHAPSLVIEDGVYDQESVTKSYDLAMRTIAESILQLVKPLKGQGDSRPYLEFSLLGDMLRTPSREMLHVETVDQAGRWNITVGPISDTIPINETTLRTSCANTLAWDRDESGIDPMWKAEVGTFAIARKDETGRNATITFDELSGEGCEIYVNDKAKSAADMEGRKLLSFLPATTRLSSLKSVPTSPPQPPEQVKPADLSSQPASTGECAIRANGEYVERLPCRMEETVVNGKLVVNYHWSSGAVTVFEAQTNPPRIDGQRSGSPTPGIDPRGACAHNYDSGKTFCYTPAPDSDELSSSAECEERLYDHNGSTMRGRRCGPSLTIGYDRPRAAMARQGVRPGTPFFEGEVRQEGAYLKIEGVARVFKAGCPPATFAVAGGFTPGLAPGRPGIHLAGSPPTRNSRCRVTGKRVEHLQFD